MTHPKRAETIHVEQLGEELCLYDWQRKEVHTLNPMAAQVWQRCDGQTSPQQIAAAFQANLPAPQAEALVWLTLERLEQAHLLAEAVVRPAPRPRMTRRKFLRLGIAGALLPVVHSILAPAPVAAQSPLPTATPTTNILYNAGGTFAGGNLGGRAGADNLCATSANRPAGYSNFRAFITVSATDEIRDMPANYGVPTTRPITGPTGTVIANNWTDLLDGSIQTTLAVAGVLPGGSLWWSGSLPDGSEASSNECGGWTQTALPNSGMIGDADGAFSAWISALDTVVCDGVGASAALLCIAF